MLVIGEMTLIKLLRISYLQKWGAGIFFVTSQTHFLSYDFVLFLGEKVSVSETLKIIEKWLLILAAHTEQN